MKKKATANAMKAFAGASVPAITVTHGDDAVDIKALATYQDGPVKYVGPDLADLKSYSPLSGEPAQRAAEQIDISTANFDFKNIGACTCGANIHTSADLLDNLVESAATLKCPACAAEFTASVEEDENEEDDGYLEIEEEEDSEEDSEEDTEDTEEDSEEDTEDTEEDSEEDSEEENEDEDAAVAETDIDEAIKALEAEEEEPEEAAKASAEADAKLAAQAAIDEAVKVAVADAVKQTEDAMKTAEVEIKVDDHVKLDTASLQLYVAPGNNRIVLMSHYTPIGELKRENATPATAKLFDNSKALRDSIVASLATKDGLTSYGYQSYSYKIKVLDAALASARTTASVETAAAVEDSIKTIGRFRQSITIAACGANRGIYPNAMADSLEKTLRVHGVKNARVVAMNVTAAASDDYVKSIFDKAEELLPLSDEARNAIASTIKTAPVKVAASSEEDDKGESFTTLLPATIFASTEVAAVKDESLPKNKFGSLFKNR